MMVMVALAGALLLAPPAHADSPVRPAQARAGDLPWNPNGLHGPVSLTHNVSLEVQPENSQACGSTQGGYTSQNSFWRVFDLNGQFGLSAPLSVESVTFGVERTDGIFDVTVRVYTLSGPFTTENLTLVAQDGIQLDHASNGMLVSVPFSGQSVSHLDDLVVEIDVPSGQGQLAEFYPGSNDLGQSGPSYLSAAACGLSQPTDLATIGYPDMHLIMVVSGDTASPTAVTLHSFESRGTALPAMAAVTLFAITAAFTAGRHRALRTR